MNQKCNNCENKTDKNDIVVSFGDDGTANRLCYPCAKAQGYVA